MCPWNAKGAGAAGQKVSVQEAGRWQREGYPTHILPIYGCYKMDEERLKLVKHAPSGSLDWRMGQERG